jgi:hypothetical protein
VFGHEGEAGQSLLGGNELVVGSPNFLEELETQEFRQSLLQGEIEARFDTRGLDIMLVLLMRLMELGYLVD